MIDRGLLRGMLKWLDALTAVQTPHTSIDEAIDRALAKRSPGRRSTWFRVGEVNNPYACDRRLMLMASERIMTDRVRRDAKSLQTMQVGIAIHDSYQREFLGPTGKLYGLWRCPSCHKHYSDMAGTYPKELCPNTVTVGGPEGSSTRECAAEQEYLISRSQAHWHYDELRVKDESLNLSGRIDGIWLESDGWYILEMKSMGTLPFQGLRKVKAKPADRIKLGNPYVQHLLTHAPSNLPRNYHVTQAALYSHMLWDICMFGDGVDLDPAQFLGVIVMYIDRDTLEKRTFVKTRVDAEVAEALQILDRRREVLDRLDLSVAEDPDAEEARIAANREVAFQFDPTCTNRNHRKAKECPWRTICFPYKKEEKNFVEYLKETANE